MKKNIFIKESATVKDALKKLDLTGEMVLIVAEGDDTLRGTITDGDIRRYLLQDGLLDKDIKDVYNANPFFIKEVDYSHKIVKKIMLENTIELVPIVDENMKVKDFVTWARIFGEGKTPESLFPKVDMPVVVMAGGKGTRLEPFSKILPKPLIPVGDKPIIELVIDRFTGYGVGKYYLTVNYKGEMIKSYLDNIEKEYDIEYIWEKEFLGTAGGVKLLEDKINGDFIVSNCDVMVKADFAEVASFHRQNKAVLTALSSIQHYEIPYGVIEFKGGGEVIDVIEKPEYTFTVNTGVYMLSKEVFDYIPEGKHYDMTDLISELMKQKKTVLTYPVNEGDYADIGQWEEYKKTVDKLQFLK